MTPYREPIESDFGGFDFITTGLQGEKVAIEWETGNISSSHRSMNKLAIALANGIIQIGVLIVPSRLLYEHLTDRIGNITELSGYLSMWESLKGSVQRGRAESLISARARFGQQAAPSVGPLNRPGHFHDFSLPCTGSVRRDGHGGVR